MSSEAEAPDEGDLLWDIVSGLAARGSPDAERRYAEMLAEAAPPEAMGEAARGDTGGALPGNRTPTVDRLRNRKWVNYGQNLQTKVDFTYRVFNGNPRSWKNGWQGIVDVVRDVESRGDSLIPMGSRWSFSRAAMNRSCVVDLGVLSRRIRFDAWQTAPGVDPDELLHVQGGTLVQRVLTLVERSMGRALAAMGGNCGQAIAGAVATGSHGSFIGRPGYPDLVRALLVVAEGGKTYWLERKSRPVISEAFAEALAAGSVGGRKVEVLRDDDALFDDAVVGLGAFGIVHSVVLETVPAYHVALERSRRAASPELMAALFDGDFDAIGLSVDPIELEVVLNPHRLKRQASGEWIGPNAAHVTILEKIPVGPIDPGGPPGASLNDRDLGKMIRGWAQLAPGTVPGLVDLLIPTLYPDRKVRGPLSVAFPLGITRAPTISMEVGVDSSDARRTLDVILGYLSRTGFLLPGALAVRQTRKSTATLSVAAWPTTFTFEFALLGVKGIENDLMKVLDDLESAGIAFRLNLGHIVSDQAGKPWLTASRMKAMYGAQQLDRWKKNRARLCPSGKVFRSELTTNLGLTT
ncbi:MAG: FAD-binding protein [Sandaracinaceae bacterium]